MNNNWIKNNKFKHEPMYLNVKEQAMSSSSSSTVKRGLNYWMELKYWVGEGKLQSVVPMAALLHFLTIDFHQNQISDYVRVEQDPPTSS